MTGDEPEDHELLAAYAAGDDGAFARLYDRYDRKLFGFIRRLLAVAGAETAEDIHQETWVAVSRAAASFDPQRSKFSTWLYTVARNKVIDHVRSEKVTTIWTGDQQAELEDLADQAAGPLEQVMTRQLAVAVVKAVESLPQAQREAFVLFTEGELSLEELGKVTGVGQETAKSRLRYARDSIRKLLSGWGLAHV